MTIRQHKFDSFRVENMAHFSSNEKVSNTIAKSVKNAIMTLIKEFNGICSRIDFSNC